MIGTFLATISLSIPLLAPTDYRKVEIFDPPACNCEGQETVDLEQSQNMPHSYTYWGVCDLTSNTCAWGWTNIQPTSFVLHIPPGVCVTGYEMIAASPTPPACTENNQCPYISVPVTNYQVNVNFEVCPEGPGGIG